MNDSRLLLDGVLRNSVDGVVAYEAIRDQQGDLLDFQFLLVNPSAERLLGQVAEELVGRGLLDTFPDIVFDGLFESFVRIVETGETLDFEYSTVRSNAMRWYRVAGVKLGDGLVMSYSDITERKQAESDLAHERNLLKEKNREILDSIYYAERIQKSMLYNDQCIHYPGIKYFSIFRPRDIVSGDFIWMTVLNGILFIAVVDCTGHGVPGAFMSLLGHNFLDSIVVHQRITETNLILELLHDRIRTRLNQSNDEITNRDGMDVCLCALDGRTGMLAFSGAKRPLYYTTSSGELRVCKGDRFSIGGIQREEKRVFTIQKVTLELGQTFFLTTDGYVDQPSQENTRFGSVKLELLLEKCGPVPLLEKQRQLETALALHQGKEPQRDDITLVGMEWSPG